MSTQRPSASTAKSIAYSRVAENSLGLPIGRLMAQALKYPDLISLAAGFVDNSTLPTTEVAESLQQIIADPVLLRRSLQYDSTAGSMRLRDTLAQWGFRDYPQARPSLDRMILTAGSNQLLHLIAEALLEPGDIVLAAAPTYFVFMGTLRALEADVVGVRADEDGMCVDSLKSQLERLAAHGLASKVKAIYLVTDFDNPAGSTLSLPRRLQLLEVVERWRVEHGPMLVLSDNAYHDLRYSGQPIAPLLALSDNACEYVIELNTFSKSFSPGIRVGWGVLPQLMVEHLLGLKSSIDFGSPHFSQILINQVLTSGAWERHLPAVIAGYRAKLLVTLDALNAYAEHLVDVTWRQPQGGMYVWLTLPENLDCSEQGPLWPAATEQGVLYVPGHHCYPSEGQPVQRNTIRLSFGALDADKITEGIRRLCSAIGSVTN